MLGTAWTLDVTRDQSHTKLRQDKYLRLSNFRMNVDNQSRYYSRIITNFIIACFLTIWIMTISMSVFRLHLNLTRSLIPGGMTRTGKRNTTGRETTMLLIRASAALTILASTLTSNAIATPSHPATYPTTVWYIFSGKKCVG